ncbi:MAG TPA: sensor histidine kinase [Gemmatimonadota bacterium]|nr:sensor histidine kinase [Gemmatimonadota bacterium]
MAALLRAPLLVKILGANGLLIAATAVVAVLLGRSGGDPLEAAAAAAVVGLAVCVPINWLLVHWALSPLRGLARTAGRVRSGDLSSRAPRSALADRQTSNLVDVFNDMLGRLARGQARLRRLGVGALEAAERERRSLAAELQDDAAQRLATLLLRVEMARKTTSDSVAAERLETLRDEMAESLEMVRRLARRLHPPELGELGLESALRAHTRAVSEQTGLRVEMSADAPLPELAPDVALVLYRIAEEALVNAVRHADASSLGVRLGRNTDDVTLVVEDDGRGLPAGASEGEGAGLGLLGMRERARRAGGSLEIDSVPGRGTRVVLSVPARSRSAPS